MKIDSTLGTLTYVSSADVVGGTIQIPREVHIITGSAFEKIKELEHIVIPWNVEIINQGAFCNSDCSAHLKMAGSTYTPSPPLIRPKPYSLQTNIDFTL